MAFAGKLLAEGQVAVSVGAIYTVPGSTTAYVNRVVFFNTNAATQTLLVYVDGSGTNRTQYRITLAQNESAVIDDNITLEAGDLIEAETTTGSAVHYTVHGAEET